MPAPAVAYWTDIFTLETWAQAGARVFTVTGFPPPNPRKGWLQHRHVRARRGWRRVPLLLQLAREPLGRRASRERRGLPERRARMGPHGNGRGALPMAVPRRARGCARSRIWRPGQR